MQRILKLSLMLCFTTGGALGQASRVDYVETAQHQIVDYLAALADLHCTEKVTQQKLNKNGHVEATEHSQYDYLLMMMGGGDDFELNESRRELVADKHKSATPPMLITNGISTALLVFHPYYRNSFDFAIESEQMLGGSVAIPVHFEHLTGRRTPLALALRNREYPVEMSGTAWLDRDTGAILRIEAHLQHDMSDVGLKSLNIQVDYRHVASLKSGMAANFPAEAVIDVTTPKQHWRNIHHFDDYRAFSTDAQQDPNVTVRKDKQAPRDEGVDQNSSGKEPQ